MASVFKPIFLAAAVLFFAGCSLSGSKTESRPASTASDATTQNTGTLGERGQMVLSDIQPSSGNAPPSSQTTTKTVDLSSSVHMQGSGSLILVEYADLECPYSKEFHQTLESVMLAHEGKIQWVYKHFPLNQHLKKATLEAEATECAGVQGKFWDYVQMVFDRTPSNNGLAEKELFTISKDLGLDENLFNDCLANATSNAKVKADAAEAQRLGAPGTPFSLLADQNGNILEVIDGLYSQKELEEIFQRY